MAGQTLLWDSRLKTVALLVPAMGAMIWIASELASEDFIIPAAIFGFFSVFVLFTVFIKTVRFEACVLCLLLVGYLVGNRGFAELTVAKPLFPGEIALILISASILFRFAMTREIPDISGWYGRVILAFCALGAVRLAFDFQTYKLDAIRDSAMVYYAAFFFFGRQLVSTPSSKRLLEKCLAFSFLALFPIALVERLAPEWLIWHGNLSPIFQKDDLLTTFAAAGVFIIYTRPKMYPQWLRVSLILFYIVLVVSGNGRASLGALIVASVLIFVAGMKRFFLYPVIALVLGLTVLAGLSASFGTSRTSDTAVLVDKLNSMVDFSGEGNNTSDYAEQKTGTNDFRRKLWASFIDETNAKGRWFGCGFGYDFVARFVEEYRLGEEGGLRSAHNFYVTLYGRMGWIGIGVFAILTGQIFVGGLRAALAVKRGELPAATLGYWCTIWTILISSIVGVVLEGPIGAIVFWSFLGVAVAISEAELAERRKLSLESSTANRLPEVFTPSRRRPNYLGEVSVPSR